MAGNSEGYSMYPGGAAMLPHGVTLPGYPVPEGAIDYRMLPYMYQQGALPEGRENAAKFTEGFEQWYAPYRMAQMQGGGHYLPYQLLGRGNEQSALASRNLTPQAQAHEAMMKNASSSRNLVIDPTTGYPVSLGNLHSHSHMHTHFHIHPLEQQQLQAQAQAQAAAAANMDRAAYLQAQAQAQAAQHPGLAWRNQQLLWQHPELMQLHANGMISPVDEHAHGASIHGLGSTPLDRQLQQHVLLSQHSKYHHHSALQQLQEESYIRHLRHQQELQMKQRLEDGATSESYLSNIFRKDSRNLQSPSQLDNVVKKSLESTGAYVSPTKKPVTIDLSDD